MSVNRYASALRRGGLRSRLVPFVVLAVLLALLGGFHAPMAQASSSPTTPIWSTQLDFDNNGTAWSESFFAGLAADGLTTAELNMPWGTIEPEAGTFNFTEWDTELANASAAGIQLIPIFWQAGWGGSPAPWINDFEVGSGGAQGEAPAWWDSDRAVRVLHLRHGHDPELREPARRLRRRDLELRLPRRPVGPQRRRRRLRGRRHQRVPEHLPAADLRHHRHVQLRQRHVVQRVQPGARGRAGRRRCSACSRRSGRGACSRPTGS